MCSRKTATDGVISTFIYAGSVIAKSRPEAHLVSLASIIVHSMRIFRRPDGRHYAISHPAPDLLGDLVIMTFHGSATSGLGGVHTYLANKTTVEEIANTRLQHGYVECSDLPSP
jgi:hypothetical protein